MIVKIQLPLVSNEENPGALVYNEDKSLLIMVENSSGLSRLMGNRVKAYFEARVQGQVMDIVKEVEDQGW